MNKSFKRFAAFIAALMILINLIPAVGATKVSYSDTKNTGVRGDICVSLEATGAQTYYSGDNSYQNLSSLSENELLLALRTLMTSTHNYKSSYADSKNYADKTDCQGGNGKITLLYTSSVVEFSDFIGSGSIGWNREHVWPKSLGGFDNNGAGADLHHIRPDDVTTNAKRGNLKYGNAQNGIDVKGSSLVSGAVGGKAAGAYFEPLDNVKGDVARICLYVYARYGGELSKCSSITNVFESVDVLLEWCESDPVDTWEMGRNEVIGKIQGNRNVFIDYPEFAWLIFGREVPQDMTTPSGMAMKTEETTLVITEVLDTDPAVETTDTDETTTEEIVSPDTSKVTSPAVTDPIEETGCAAVLGSGIIIIIIPALALIRKKKE